MYKKLLFTLKALYYILTIAKTNFFVSYPNEFRIMSQLQSREEQTCSQVQLQANLLRNQLSAFGPYTWRPFAYILQTFGLKSGTMTYQFFILIVLLQSFPVIQQNDDKLYLKRQRGEQANGLTKKHSTMICKKPFYSDQINHQKKRPFYLIKIYFQENPQMRWKKVGLNGPYSVQIISQPDHRSQQQRNFPYALLKIKLLLSYNFNLLFMRTLR